MLQALLHVFKELHGTSKHQNDISEVCKPHQSDMPSLLLLVTAKESLNRSSNLMNRM